MRKILISAIIAITPSIILADMDRCVSCHGVDFEKKALGVSIVVKDMSESEIKAALDGYKQGKGGSMKELMMQEVNLGVDTDAMAADIYNEARTPGFDEPDDEFIFQKRYSVKSLHKIKVKLQKAKSKDEVKKIKKQIEATALELYTYDKLLREEFNFDKVKANKKPLSKKEILKRVSKAKKCVDHSFDEKSMLKCRVDFMDLAVSFIKDKEKAIKAKSKKAPIYTGEGAVDISKYLKHKK
jgi:hypothetical protein